jgi:uncharacterized protein (UPF0332 family)
MATPPRPSFDWQDYLTLADELGSRKEESCLRTAISRAYYCVYHLAYQRVLDSNLPIGGSSLHQQVWKQFILSSDRGYCKLGNRGQLLRDKRKQADYDSDFAKIGLDLPTILNMAKKFAEDLAKLPKQIPMNTRFPRP